MSVYLSIYFIIHMKLRVFGRSAAVPVVRGRFFLGLQDTPARRSFRNSQESSATTANSRSDWRARGMLHRWFGKDCSLWSTRALQSHSERPWWSR